MAASREPARVPKRAYRNGIRNARLPVEARERIMLAAAVADLREGLYAQQCLLEALIAALAEQGLIDGAALRRRVKAAAQDAGPAGPAVPCPAAFQAPSPVRVPPVPVPPAPPVPAPPPAGSAS